MKNSTRTVRHCALILAAVALSTAKIPLPAYATDGTWANPAGGTWSTAANWASSSIADGTGSSANFSTLTLTSPLTIHLDSSRSIGTLTFGDVANLNDTTLDNNGSANHILNLSTSSGSPTINVLNRTASINLALAGSKGLTKTGPGTLLINNSATYTDSTVISQGTLRLGTNGFVPTANLTVAAGATFDLGNHSAIATSLTGAGTITGQLSNATFQVNNSASLATSVAITGNIGFWKLGAGALELDAPSTYTGTTFFDGPVKSGVDNALPIATTLQCSGSGTFDLNGHDQIISRLTLIGGSVTNSSLTRSNFTLNASVDHFVSGTLGGNLNFIKSGPANVTFSLSAPTYTGATTINAGTLTFSSAATSLSTFTGNGTLAVTDKHALTADSVRLSNLNLVGTLTIRPNGTFTATSRLNTLTLAGSTNNWGGKLDLNNNKLIVDDSTTHAATLATLQNQVAYGLTHPTGILSSTRTAAQSLVVVDNAVANLFAFGNLKVDTNSILLGTFFNGDANLNGSVDNSDLNLIAFHWQQPASDWTQGDFNHDGQVTIADLNLLAANWQSGVAPGSASVSFTEALNSAFAISTPAPEPTSLTLLTCSILPLLKRRTH